MEKVIYDEKNGLWYELQLSFAIYRLLMHVDIVVGNTLPDMLITIVICVAVSKIRSKIKK